jgi:hypothetical protein
LEFHDGDFSVLGGLRLSVLSREGFSPGLTAGCSC